MMINLSQQPQSSPRRARVIHSAGLACLLLASAATYGQDTVEWTTLGNDFAHTRYSPADQIGADNFDQLEVAWTWDGSSFQAQSGRSTPSYINGRMYTVA
ncbi:MAG: hypothetical protein CMQ12_06365 [Gammaproteobacteria bacterium]|nr:hypothetical protein [Gammaproteobacteria bacterium]